MLFKHLSRNAPRLTAAFQLIGAGLFGTLAASAQSLDPIRVDVSPAGQQSASTYTGTNKYLSTPAISADGRYISFDSGASDLLPLSIPRYHVFLRDLVAGTTELVSQSSTGAEADGIGGPISADGRFVLFASSRIDNFTFADQLYLRDRQSSTTTLVSGPPTGGPPNQSWLAAPGKVGALSADGRYSLFLSLASNLITPNESNQTTADLFLFDRVDVTTRRIAAVNPNASSSIFDFEISGDGSTVVFATDDPSIVTGDQNNSVDVFMVSLPGGSPVKIFSHAGDSTYFVKRLSLSNDGRYLAFATNIPLDPRHGALLTQVYAYDRSTNQVTLVSLGQGGAVPDNSVSDCSISADGQLIAFSSAASNLVNGAFGSQVYLSRWQAGETVAISRAPDGSLGDGLSFLVSLSPSGEFASFLSFAANLVPNDTNIDADYFRVAADACPSDPAKIVTGQCGCGAAETDTDGDGTADCADLCSADPSKQVPGTCGCGALEKDGDGDGVTDCMDILVPGTKLTEPPQVAVSKRTVKITLKRFAAAIFDGKTKRFLLSENDGEVEPRAQQRLPVQYEVTLTKKGGGQRDRIQRISRRNEVTIRGLSPGTYSASYVVFAARGSKRVVKTNSSPRATFTVK